MAGIGFVLRRLIRADRLSANLSGFSHATLAASGPWLFTCLVLIAISLVGQGAVPRQVLQQFSILVAYNFSLALVGSGSIVFVVTRSLANRIYDKDLRGVSDMLLGSLCLVFGVMALLGGLLYGLVIKLPPFERTLAYIGLLLLGGIWLVAAFMSALKSYWSITASFFAGMATAFIASTLLIGHYGLGGLLSGFALGLAVIFFSLVGRVLVEYPGEIRQPFAFLPEFPRFWQLALVGLLLNSGLWVDKWVMLFSPGAAMLGRALFTHEAYEGAMFLAYLSIVPSMALLLVDIETRFFEVYLHFYKKVAEHATLEEIRLNHGQVVRILSTGLKRIALLQTVVCLSGLLLAPALVSAVGGGVEMVTILRFGLFGALFHMLLISALTVLAYFDLRRELIWVSATFLALNAGLTACSVWLGAEFHGYGYGLAALLSFALAYHLAASRVNRLPYLTFIANNPAL